MITLTAIRPGSGLGKGREIALFRLSNACLSISALNAVFRDLYGVVRPEKVRGVSHKGKGIFAIIVGIGHPECNIIAVIGDNSAGLRLENIDLNHFDSNELFTECFCVKIFDLEP